jgi:hypothetical protein
VTTSDAHLGRRPPKFTLPQRPRIKKMAWCRWGEHGLSFSAWSLSELAEFVIAEGRSTTSAMRALLREEGASFQRLPAPAQAAVSRGQRQEQRARPRSASTDAAYTRTERVRHLLVAYELGEDKLFRT